MDVAPGRRRHLLDEGQHFCIAARLVLRDQPRKDSGVVIDDGVRDRKTSVSRHHWDRFGKARRNGDGDGRLLYTVQREIG